MKFSRSNVFLGAAVLITSWALYVVTKDIQDALEIAQGYVAIKSFAGDIVCEKMDSEVLTPTLTKINQVMGEVRGEAISPDSPTLVRGDNPASPATAINEVLSREQVK